MAQSSAPGPDANAAVGALLAEARRLETDYKGAFARYAQRTASTGLAAAIVTDYFEIPDDLAVPGLRLLLDRWESTSEYKALSGQFEALYGKVKTFLRTVSQRTQALFYPGNSQRLLSKLRPVGDAVRLDTRIRRLSSVMEEMDLRDLVFNVDLPRKSRARRTALKGPSLRDRPSRRGTPTDQNHREWNLLAILVSVAVSVALSVGLSTSFGWAWAIGLAAVVGVAISAVIALTEPAWSRAFKAMRGDAGARGHR